MKYVTREQFEAACATIRQAVETGQLPGFSPNDLAFSAFPFRTGSDLIEEAEARVERLRAKLAAAEADLSDVRKLGDS